jgi:hypothetical protein
MQTTLARETIGSNIAKFEMEATRKLPTGLTEIFGKKELQLWRSKTHWQLKDKAGFAGCC